MIEPQSDRPNKITFGGDNGFESADFVKIMR